jgi:hypothetical protein
MMRQQSFIGTDTMRRRHELPGFTETDQEVAGVIG